MKLYKVLERTNGNLVSPIQKYKYEPGEEYSCPTLDMDRSHDCSTGFYATGIDGLIYSFRNLPEYEVWECEVDGRAVEIDQFKRRYERIKLLRHVTNEEVKKLALAIEAQVGYKLAEALFPMNPFKIVRTHPPTEAEIELLKQWANVETSVWNSAWASVDASVWASVWANVWVSVRVSVRDSVRNSVGDSVGGSVGASVWDSVGAYISSLFPGIKKWKYIDHSEGINPFQPCIDLWHAGLVPGYDGTTWRLHAGERTELVWEDVRVG